MVPPWEVWVPAASGVWKLRLRPCERGLFRLALNPTVTPEVASMFTDTPLRLWQLPVPLQAAGAVADIASALMTEPPVSFARFAENALGKSLVPVYPVIPFQAIIAP